MKTLIFVHGSYYNKNFGDYLLLKRTVDQLNTTVRLPFASKKVLNEFSGNILPTTFKDFFNAKACIFGGGGYLGEPPESVTKWSINFIRRHFLPFLLMRLFSIEVHIIGAGLGPISKTWLKPFLRYMLKHSKSVYLRDKESIAFARKINADVHYELVTDLAQDREFLSEISCSSSIPLPSKYIAIHIGSKIKSEVEDKIDLSIKNVARNGYSIVFFSDSPGHNDNLDNNSFSFSNMLNDKTYSIFKLKYENAEDVTRIISNSSGVITGKLHTGIIASTFSIPVLSIPLHHKTKRYYRDIGKEFSCILNGDKLSVSFEKIERFETDVLNGDVIGLNQNVLSRHEKAMNAISHVGRLI